MIRSSKLPLLPGYSFEHEVGQERYHKSTQFEYLRGLIPYLSETDRPGSGGYPLPWATPGVTPSIYPRRECKELPGWLTFDKQILTFEAFFQEAMWEVDKSPYQIRKVKIFFYLEDGTIQVVEPKVDNSGMAQGVLIARQRIRFPKPMDQNFYDLVDFNIGKNVELFGRVFRIVSCDKFTRNFLNRMGIFVGDPLNYPVDLYEVEAEKKKYCLVGKKPRKTTPCLGKYLEFDKKVLRFYGYWDDRSSQYGYVHNLQINFFLADDTIEIQEIVPPNSGIDCSGTFLKRTRLPKSYSGLPGPGEEESFTLLNVLPTGFLKGRYVVDPINPNTSIDNLYRETDLVIGATLNVFGRKVFLTDCDEFTKEFYRTKYGIDTFDKLPTPDDSNVSVLRKNDLPPWNGIGSYEDSEGNCRRVIPEPPKKDMIKFLTKGRMGIDGHILRFTAKMISVDSVNNDRNFVISYYLSDDQISVYERASRNSGFTSQYFLKKREIFKPDQERFVSVKPETFQKHDLWIGNVLDLDGFKFKLTGADEYCLRYMELHNQEFPKSNSKIIIEKIKEKLRPVYKEFVNRFLMSMENRENKAKVLPFCNLRMALLHLFGNEISEHEIITIARQFRCKTLNLKHTKKDVLNTCKTECRKKIWLGFDRLRENLYYRDHCCTGYVSEKVAYSFCKGAKIPIEPDLLDTVMKLVERNECGDVSIENLLNYFDTQTEPHMPVVPFNQKREFSEFSNLTEINDCNWVDCDCLLKSIGLEEDLTKDGHTEKEKRTNVTSTLLH